ncbi:hypothetical protein WH218_06000 [Stenotrophomonas indicatrix]|jgi:hypothetical protein|uniref:Transmembrane protein n=1 Tax=Stenotrophomonas indicatrix TaxID=2045451 RepID=A0A1W1GV16_9GAMM|nr:MULTISPECIES: hypothetical protein [Stenotrophomonas]OJH79804.1 MAG: hypothetical protein BSK19_05790 [Stenotrophomonas maltophilia]MBA0098609.1 hypothetical protein [Stenotrophomonas indicatrix]MCK6231357.1 hypothetical protein [Stenotrophomonas indicatrix]MDH6329349.1 hypothetical protein [Stenotrophomonas sp. 1278]MDN8646738.1 hypothetical protein [Stenotrophomonas indicatrix]
MHVLLVIVGGFLLLAVFALFGRLWSTSSPQLPTALLAFIGTWLLVSVANMWVGVSRAGYTVREELPILLLVFAVPALVAGVIFWRLGR